MSVLAPISVHVLIVLTAAIAVAVFFTFSERDIFGSWGEE
jgi:hypothetical protein